MTTILIKKKDTAGAPAPGDLTNSAGGTEIAVNTATKRIYTKDSGGNVVELATNASSSTIDQLTVTTSETLSYGTANGVAYLNGSKVLTTGSALQFDGSNLGLGVTPSAWSQGTAFEMYQKGYGLWNGSGSPSSIYLTANTYYNAGFKYANTGGYATTYYQYQGQHVWNTAPSGTAGNTISFTQAMTLDASGRLLVGATATDSGAQFRFQYTGSSQNGLQLFDNTNTSGSLFAIFGYNTGSGNNNAGTIARNGTDNAIIVNGTSYLALGSNGSECARIDSSGNLLVGTTSGTGNGERIYSVTSTFVPFAGRHSSTSAGKFWFFGPNSGNNYVVQNQSSVGVYITDGGTSWTSTSDERIKTNLIPIENAVQKVSTLRAVTGRFKTDDIGVSRAFLIAQDVKAVLPEAVSMDNDEIGTLGVSYTETIPLLVAAIKELAARVATLEGTQP